MFAKIFGTNSTRFVKSAQPFVKKINALEEGYAAKSDEDLAACTATFRTQLANGTPLDNILPEAFAVAREGAKRALGMRPYDIQLVGALALHKGKIAEMKTGEGKTLVAAMAAYVNALEGKGVHVVTVNDYLAARDAAWMGKLYNFLGLSVGAIVNNVPPQQRPAVYQSDIVYATNNELGFDYLRDNMAFDSQQLVQRAPYFAIVDEVDSILIDEARTPLIISGPAEHDSKLYVVIDKLVQQLSVETDFEKDEKTRSITLTDVGTDKIETALKQNGLLQQEESLYDIQHVKLVHHINNALRAHHIYRKDDHYIVHENNIVLIDEFTGRMTPGRRLGDGQHQAVEAKEGVPIKQENQTLASTTFQNYFRLYPKLAGMTGTAATEAEEFDSIYNMEVIELPTNIPIARNDEADILYLEKPIKTNAIIADIKDCYERGQPVLVGTVSIEKSEELSAALQAENVPHKILNARHHAQEADIIAQAGRFKAVTIATNMAGRGTDIKLGGNLELLLKDAFSVEEVEKITAAYEEEKQKVLAAGGLRVIGTERHESRRIDNQLRGRSGRQGDVGSSVFYLSTDDDLLRIFAQGLMGKLIQRMKNSDSEDKNAPVQSNLFSKSIETAQKKIEGMHFDSRKQILRFDDILNEQRKVIYAQRREILEAELVDDIVEDFRYQMLDTLSAQYMPEGISEDQWQPEEFNEAVQRVYHVSPLPLDKWMAEEAITAEEIAKRTQAIIDAAWQAKEEHLSAEVLRKVEKQILLQIIDRLWRSHLQQLDYLRQGIYLRGYAQKDPVNEYASESFALFERLLSRIREETTSVLSRVDVHPEDLAKIRHIQEARAAQIAEAEVSGGEEVETGVDASDNPYANQNVSRNGPCPCGSGKKYKHCHGKLTGDGEAA